MSGNKYIIDSSAWIEYLEATPKGSKVADIIELAENEIFTPNIVVAEVASIIARKGHDPQIALSAMRSLSMPANEETIDYYNAGKMHAELRKKTKNISLADAIIFTLAEKNKAKIVTKDSHLKGKNTVFIE